MKWAFGVLLIVNAGLFLWAYGHKPGSDALARPIVNAQSMRLLSEQKVAKKAAPDDLVVSQAVCYRIGPFYGEDQRDRSTKKLQALKLAYSLRTVKAREIRAYRVFLGPYSNDDTIATQRTVLRADGVTDHYIKREQGGNDVISLGLFSQQSGADAMIQQLKAKNVPAKIRAEDRQLGATHWLEFRESGADLEARTILSATRWGDDRTRFRSFPCSPG